MPSMLFVRRFVAVLTLPFLVSACGGGGGGDNGSAGPDLGSPTLISITAVSNQIELLGPSTPAPTTCPPGIALTSPLVFEFGGVVDPASLPANGFATGSINIINSTPVGANPASGFFRVEDDPALPAGNARRVIFQPTLPSVPGGLTGFGQGNQRFDIILTTAVGGIPAVTVAGVPFPVTTQTCFESCNPALGSPCLGENVIGPPYIAATIPAASDPPPPPIDPAAPGNDRLILTFSEALDPAGISLSSVVLRNTLSNAQVQGTLIFFQAGTSQAGPVGSRIDYVFTNQLLGSATYEIVLAPELRDLSGQPAQLYQPGQTQNPVSGRRLFSTAALVFCDQPPLVESFDTPNQGAALSSNVVWTGNGLLQATYPFDILGTGLFGPLVFPNPGPATLDPGQPAIMVGNEVAFENGIWNATDFQVVAGATVRSTGHTFGNVRRVHVRCTGSVTIAGTVNLNAGQSLTAPLGDTEQGPRIGLPSNGTPNNPTWVAGGVGGSGGGVGGNASQADQLGIETRTLRGETGKGPPVNGQVNLGTTPEESAYNGGGTGGLGDFAEGTGGSNVGHGGRGGAGGSSFRQGEVGSPRIPGPACTFPTPAPNPAQPSTIPAAFVPPISVPSAGSGGGGGGDLYSTQGVSSDLQGSAGGGGGGGIRLTSFGSITIAPAAVITCRGATGGATNSVLNGSGGGGSGGQIWLQSFSTIDIAATARLDVSGGTSPIACGAQSSGAGSVGLIQLEAAVGTPSTSFLGAPSVPGAIQVVPFPAGQTVVTTTTSRFYDLGYDAPDYTVATITTNLSQVNVSGASVTVTFQGANPLVSGTGPDLTTLTPAVAGNGLDALDGRRFVRFIAVLSYPSPPVSSVTSILPAVEEVRIGFRTPNCGAFPN